MEPQQFWDIIAEACRSDPYQADQWDGRLTAVLRRLPADEIVEWNHLFDRLAAQACTIDLLKAALLINSGAGDDGFYYFRCWLIGMGREVYEAALANPDSLANVMNPRMTAEGIDAEAEIYAAAYQAWLAVTGRSDTDAYPARNEHADLQGEDWDFDNDDEVRRRLPRLAVMYLE